MMTQQNINHYFNIFLAYQQAWPHANQEAKNYLVRGFSTTQGAFTPDVWRVVGITKAALESFRSVGCERIPGRKDPQPVERAHIYQRHVWISEMFEREWLSAEEWWQWIWEHDQCVLSTLQENQASDKLGTPLEIWREIPQGAGYFKSNFIGCKYRKSVEKKLIESFLVDLV